MNQFKGGFILPFPNNWNRNSLFLKISLCNDNFYFCNLSSKKDYKLPVEEFVHDSIRYNARIQVVDIEINVNSAIEVQVNGLFEDKCFILNFNASKLGFDGFI
jgi:hypothetical protein